MPSLPFHNDGLKSFMESETNVSDMHKGQRFEKVGKEGMVVRREW